MSASAPNQDEVKVAIALNILCGNIKPEQWRGFMKVDEEEAAILTRYRQIRDWGHGRMEVVVLQHQLDTLHATNTYKKKDLIKGCPGT